MKNRYVANKIKNRVVSFMLVMASMVFVIPEALAAEFCVANAAELTNALAVAVANGQDDTIKIVKGTYIGNNTFNSGEGHSITLLGGYNTGCTTRTINPENTILDAQNSGRVLYLYNSDGGGIIVDGVTIRNGNGSDGSEGAGLYLRSDKPVSGDAGDITLTHNIISGNSASGNLSSGGGVHIYSKADNGSSANILISDNIITGNTIGWWGGGIYTMTESASGGNSGEITVTNNIIAANTATLDGGGVNATTKSMSGGNSGEITITNNIIAGNTTTSSLGGGMYIKSYVDRDAYICGDAIICNNTVTGNQANTGGGISIYMRNGAARFYNNIIWGNSVSWQGDDLNLCSDLGIADFYGYYNDYSVLYSSSWKESGNNIDEDPLFMNPAIGNYHLKGSSPCRDAGIYGKKIYIPVLEQWTCYNYGYIPDDDFEDDSRDSDWIEVTTNNYYKYCDIGADEYTSTFLPCVQLLLLSD